MNTKNQLICLWGGYAFLPLYFVGFILIAGFIPSLPPSWNGAELAAFVDLHRLSISIGMCVSIIASALYVPFSVAIFEQMARMEEGFPRLGYSQVISGGIGAVFFALSPMLWGAIAFRQNPSPEAVLILDDFAWISWMMSWVFFDIQMGAVALCSLRCKPEHNFIPRWAGYYSLFVSVSFFPACMVMFLKTGPFAWNGMIALYLPLAFYAIWFQIMFNVLLKANKRERMEQSTGNTNGGTNKPISAAFKGS